MQAIRWQKDFVRIREVKDMEQTLMALVGEHSQIMEMINDPEVDQQTVLDTLEAVEGDISVKANGYGHVLRGIKYERAAIAGKKEYLKKLLDALDKQDDRLAKHEEGMKDRLMAAMIATGLDETGIEAGEFKFTMRDAGGVQKLEKTGEVPEAFKEIVTTFKDDDKKIREYLENHNVKWARLLPRKKILDIKGV